MTGIASGLEDNSSISVAGSKEPSANCSSPFRNDTHPSFSVFDDGKAFNDFATGDAGNVFRFYGIAAVSDSSTNIGRSKIFSAVAVIRSIAKRPHPHQAMSGTINSRRSGKRASPLLPKSI